MELIAHQIAILRAMEGVIKPTAADIIPADTGKFKQKITLAIMREMVKKVKRRN